MAKAKKRPAFSISISSASPRPPIRLSLNRPLLAVLLLVGAAVVYLAGLSAYNMFSQNNTTNGNDLAFQGSGSVREHEREDQIVQLKNLNTQLQQENSRYKQDISDLDTRVKQLADSIETLKAFAKQLQDKVGGADSSALPPIPTPSGSTSSNNTTGSLYGGNTALASNPGPGASNIAATQNYYAEYDKVLGQLQNINQTITAKKQGIADLGVKIQNYHTQLVQTATTYNIDSQRAVSKDVTISFDASAPGDVPVDGPISSPFGWRQSPFHPGAMGFHYGIDLAVQMNTPVRATKAGTVTYAAYDDVYGWRIEITHPGGWLSFYAHNTILMAKVGQTVDKGAIIALSGTTGASTGPHVHYEVHYNGVPVNPVLYMKVPLKYDTNL